MEEGIAVIKGCFADGPVLLRGRALHDHRLRRPARSRPRRRRRSSSAAAPSGCCRSPPARPRSSASTRRSTAARSTRPPPRTAPPSETDQKLGWVKDAAGDRYADLEINLLQFAAIVTDDRKGTAEMMAPLFGLPARGARHLPARLHRHRRRDRRVARGPAGALGRVLHRVPGRHAWRRWPRSSPSSAAPEPAMADDRVDLAFAGAGWIAAVHGYAVDHVPGLRDQPRWRRATRREAAAAAERDAAPSPAPTTTCPPAPTASSCARRRPSTSSTPAAPSTAAPACSSRSRCAPRSPRPTRWWPPPRRGRAHRLRREPRPRADRPPGPRPRRPAPRHRPRRGAGAAVPPDVGRLPHRGLGRRRAVRPRRPPARGRAAARRPGRARGGAGHPRRAPTTIPSTSTPRCSSTSTPGLLARVTASWRGGDTPDVGRPGVGARRRGPHRAAPRAPARAQRHRGRASRASPRACPRQLEELGYLTQIESFALDLQQGRAARSSAPPSGGAILDVVCAAYASAGQDGEWVDLPFTGPRDRTPLQLWRG